MNQELKLKLQAWVDGELSEGEARRVSELAGTNAEAESLVAELRMTRSFLAGNEPEVKLPESREFYWSKIRREIERREQEPDLVPGVRWLSVWRRLLAPLSGVALVAFVSMLSLNLFQRGKTDDALTHLVEVENPSEHIGSISYKSQAENMFVVWLYDKDQEADTDANKTEPLDDMSLQ